LDSVIGSNEIHLDTSSEHHANWLDCVRSRKQPLAPIEIGHRACSTCLLHHIAMKTGRHLHWDPERECFKDDEEATAMLSRRQRSPYTFEQSSWA
jgi:GFO/IDH/MocA oxidoreductase family protein